MDNGELNSNLSSSLQTHQLNLSLRASANTGVAIPYGYRHFGDCHTSDIGHWFAMTT